jgi:hypothetical protein
VSTWADPEAYLNIYLGRFGPNTAGVEQLLGRTVSMSTAEIAKLAEAHFVRTGPSVVRNLRGFLSMNGARKAATAAGRSESFTLASTAGVEAVVRASVRELQAGGQDIEVVVLAMEEYRRTHVEAVEPRKVSYPEGERRLQQFFMAGHGDYVDGRSRNVAATDFLRQTLQQTIGIPANQDVSFAGGVAGAAASAVVVWDLATRRGPFKFAHRKWLTQAWLNVMDLPEGYVENR